jgi:hypothetical protein
MKRLVLLFVVVGGLVLFSVASVGADPGSNNPRAQHRTLAATTAIPTARGSSE